MLTEEQRKELEVLSEYDHMLGAKSIRAAIAEIDELRKDRDRLDKMERLHENIPWAAIFPDGKRCWELGMRDAVRYGHPDYKEFSTLREALDATPEPEAAKAAWLKATGGAE